MSHWVTIEKAVELRGLPYQYLQERTGPAGHWTEGEVWKWIDGRKVIDLDALDALYDKAQSTPTNRGRRPANDACPEAPAAQRA